MEQSNTSDFEDQILKRRLEDSEENSENFESLRSRNQIFVKNPNQLSKKSSFLKPKEGEKIGVGFNGNYSFNKKVPSIKMESLGEMKQKKSPQNANLQNTFKVETMDSTTENSKTHPFFQNYRPSIDKKNLLLSKNVENKKSSRDNRLDSPNNAKGSKIDFNFENYNKKIEAGKN